MCSCQNKHLNAKCYSIQLGKYDHNLKKKKKKKEKAKRLLREKTEEMFQAQHPTIAWQKASMTEQK